MKLKCLKVHPYKVPLTTGKVREGLLLKAMSDTGACGWGDIAPLPGFSLETLDDANTQLEKIRASLLLAEWSAEGILETLQEFNLLPSVSFGLESSLFSILCPLPEHQISASALLMGSPHEILSQAEKRKQEGFTTAKLKVNNLSFKEAYLMIRQLKDHFFLRIDVNRAWTTKEALLFFDQFPTEIFDYVEEPFQNPDELALFTHPLAIDESFPSSLSLEQLSSLPQLKALIYKPTIQGGMHNCLHVLDWTKKNNIRLILSSSFETELGIAHIGSLAHRLSIKDPVGVGTYHFLNKPLSNSGLSFANSYMKVPSYICPGFQ